MKLLQLEIPVVTTTVQTVAVSTQSVENCSDNKLNASVICRLKLLVQMETPKSSLVSHRLIRGAEPFNSTLLMQTPSVVLTREMN